jgi:hypothetical protein
MPFPAGGNIERLADIALAINQVGYLINVADLFHVNKSKLILVARINKSNDYERI